MNLQEKLTADLKEAMKSGEQFKVGVLRLLSSAIHNKEIDTKAKTGSYELSDETVLGVLMAEAKKRKEAIEVFEKGGRPELSAKERQELAIIQNYLPKELSPAEAEQKIKEVLRQAQDEGKTLDFGSAMKAVMKELRGKVDAKLVGEIVKKLIAN